MANTGVWLECPCDAAEERFRLMSPARLSSPEVMERSNGMLPIGHILFRLVSLPGIAIGGCADQLAFRVRCRLAWYEVVGESSACLDGRMTGEFKRAWFKRTRAEFIDDVAGDLVFV